MDKSNIEKNKQHNIVSPQPIPNFQTLISAVITPKISAITQKFGSLSGSFLGGSSGGGSTDGNGDGNSGSGGSGSALGGIVSSLFKLSGPILSASTGLGAGGGVASGTNDLDSDFDNDDF